MNAAILQQQQQQAYLLAYCQNLYQQSLLNLQTAQSRMAAAGGNPATNPWLGSSAPNTSPYYPPGSTVSAADTGSTQNETSVPSVKDQNSLIENADDKGNKTPLSDHSSLSSITVEHLDKDDSDSSILSCASSYRNVAPDLVQSVANLSMSSFSPSNYWKVEGKSLC